MWMFHCMSIRRHNIYFFTSLLKTERMNACNCNVQRFPVDYEELVNVAKRTGTLLEVNNSSLKPGGFRKNTRENSIAMLKECRKQGAMVVLGTDSHVDVTLGDYTYVEEVLKETDFPEELIANISYKKLLNSLKHRRNV